MGGGGSKGAKKEILIIGLDNAGKTTFFKQLQAQLRLAAGEIETAPTIGYNNEAVAFKQLKMNVVDMGGRESARSLWSHNYALADAIIFIIDCTDGGRLPEVSKELAAMMEDPDLNPHAVILFFANKQDVHGCIKIEKLKKELNLETALKNRTWHVQASSTANATGLTEGMDWIASQLKKQPTTKKPNKEKEKDSSK